MPSERWLPSHGHGRASAPGRPDEVLRTCPRRDSRPPAALPRQEARTAPSPPAPPSSPPRRRPARRGAARKSRARALPRGGERYPGTGNPPRLSPGRAAPLPPASRLPGNDVPRFPGGWKAAWPPRVPAPQGRHTAPTCSAYTLGTQPVEPGLVLTHPGARREWKPSWFCWITQSWDAGRKEESMFPLLSNFKGKVIWLP